MSTRLLDFHKAQRAQYASRFEQSIGPFTSSCDVVTAYKIAPLSFQILELIAYSDIAETLIANGQTGKVKLTPVCVDSAENVYRGEPWDVDPREFLQMGDR